VATGEGVRIGYRSNIHCRSKQGMAMAQNCGLLTATLQNIVKKLRESGEIIVPEGQKPLFNAHDI